MADEFVTKATFIKIDMTESDSEIPDKYDISLLPSTAIFKDGKLTETIVGDDVEPIRAAVAKVL